MAIPSGIVQKRTCVRIRTLGPVIFLGAQAVILAPSRTRPTEQTKQASNDSARRAEAPAEKAWRILHEGLEDANSERRARAVHALGLLAGSAGAEKAAVQGLQDEKPNVRLAAAAALEAIALRGDPSVVPKISAALDDDKDVVRFTAAACVAHLSGQPGKPGSSNAAKP